MSLDHILQYGSTTAVLLLGALFFYRALWPYLKKQIADAQSENKHITTEFLEALRRRDQEFAKIIVGLAKLGEKIDATSAKRRVR